MITWVEEFGLFFLIPLVALFASRIYTYEFSTPKFLILSIYAFVLFSFLTIRYGYKVFKERRQAPSAHQRSKTSTFFTTPIHLVWLMFGVVSLLSITNIIRDNPVYTRWSLDIGLYLLVNIFLSFYFSHQISEKRNILWYLILFVVPGFYIAVSSILNFYTGYDPLLGKVGQPFIRGTIRSTVGNVIFVANYLNMLLPITFYFVLSRDYSIFGRRPLLKAFLVKLISMVAAVLIIVVLSIAQTRSELIALTLGILLFLALYLTRIRSKPVHSPNGLTEAEKKKLERLTRVMTFVSLLACIVTFLAFNFSSELVGSGAGTIIARFSGEIWSSSKDERFLSWLSSIPVWKRHKILGQGIGTYKIYDLYGVSEVLKKRPELNYVWNNFKKVHNEYLQQLSETGIVGFLLLVTLLLMLAVYVIQNLTRLEERDDALLFASLVVSAVVFAVQCVFSFPAQVLPNALAANFFISVGLGRYFNRTSLKRLEVRRSVALVVLILLTVVSGFSAYLRYNRFWAEVYGKLGMERFHSYNNYQNSLQTLNQQLEQLQNMQKDLENLSGQFAFLKPENWHWEKQRESKVSGVPYNQASAEVQRLQTIENIRRQINEQLSQLRRQLENLESEIPTLFYESIRYLEKSIRFDPTFGKSHFYLANWAVDPKRVQMLQSQLQVEPSLVLEQRYDECQEFILPEYKYRHFAFLTEIVKKSPQLANYLQLAQAQALLDSVGLHETSLRYFSERNAYRALAQRYGLLAAHVRYMKLVLGEQFSENLQKLFDEFLSKYIHWTVATVTLKPGSWMKFPDWRSVDIESMAQGGDVYRALTGLGFELLPATDTRLVKLLEDVGRIEVTASLSMEEKNYWGVPDGTFELFAGVAMLSKDKTLIDKVLELYRPAYEYLKRKFENWNAKALYDERIRSVLNEVGRILDKESASVNKAYVVERLGQLLRRVFEQVVNKDFAKLQSSYFETLLSNDPRTWSLISKTSTWRSAFNSAMSEFRELLKREKVSDEVKGELETFLSYLIDPNADNNNMMFAYERYAYFVAGYEYLMNFRAE